MALVKVWNDNIYPFKQQMKGVVYEVPAGGSIEMEYEEAVDFVGMFSPMPPEDYAGDHREFHKMLRYDAPPPTAVFKDDGLTNHLTGQKASSPEELAAALAQVRHLLVKDADAERAAPPKADVVADLQRQVAELAALVKGQEKRGPGRPKKEA